MSSLKLKLRARYQAPSAQDSDLAAAIARAGLRLNAVQVALFDTYFAGLKAAGLWTDLEVLQFGCLGNGFAGAGNFRSTSYKGRPGANTLHVPTRGWQGDNARNALMALGYPTDGSAKLKQDIGFAGVWTFRDGLDEAAPRTVLGAATGGGDVAQLGMQISDSDRLRGLFNNLSRPNFHVTKSSGFSWMSRNSTDGTGNLRIGHGQRSILRQSPSTGLPPSALSLLGDGISGHGTDNVIGLLAIAGDWNNDKAVAFYNLTGALLIGLGVVESIDLPDQAATPPNFMTKAMISRVTVGDVMMQTSGPADDTVTEATSDDFPLSCAYSSSSVMGPTTYSGGKCAVVWVDRKNDGLATRPNGWRYGVGKLTTSDGWECRTQFSSEATALASLEAIIAWHTGKDDATVEAIVTDAGMATPLYGTDVIASQATIDAAFSERVPAPGSNKAGGLPTFYSCPPIDTVILPPWKICEATGGGTSTTSLAIGTGSKSLTTQTNKSFTVGLPVILQSAADGDNWMVGRVSSYGATSGALVVAVSAVHGSGTHTDWKVFAQRRIGLDYEAKDGRSENGVLASFGRIRTLCDDATCGPVLLVTITGDLANSRQAQSGLTLNTLPTLHQTVFDVIYLQVTGSTAQTAKQQIEAQTAMLHGPLGDQAVDYSRLAIQCVMGNDPSPVTRQNALDAHAFAIGTPSFRSDGTTQAMFGAVPWSGGADFGGDSNRSPVINQWALLMGDVTMDASVGEQPPGTDGLEVDFERNDLIDLDDAGGIVSITDTVNGTVISQDTDTKRPAFSIMSNGRQAALADGLDDCLEANGILPGLYYGSDDCYISVVGENLDTTSTSGLRAAIAWGQGSAPSIRKACIDFTAGKVARTETGDGGSTQLDARSTSPFVGLHYAIFKINASQIGVGVDGETLVVTNGTVSTPTSPTPRLRLFAGAGTSASQFWKGYINRIEVRRCPTQDLLDQFIARAAQRLTA